jgi:hypothetical protein
LFGGLGDRVCGVQLQQSNVTRAAIGSKIFATAIRLKNLGPACAGETVLAACVMDGFHRVLPANSSAGAACREVSAWKPHQCLSLIGRRLGKQPHRLPNIGVNSITDVGLDEASPTYGAAAAFAPLPEVSRAR